MQSHNKIVACR